MVEAGQNLTARRRTDDIVARLVHAERHTVQDDHAHADAFEPCEVGLRQMMDSFVRRQGIYLGP